MLKVGLTGGIGSGKSVVSKLLEAMGYTVFNSDIEAKNISDTHPEVRQELINLFGEEIYAGDELNRPLLAQFIFSNEDARKRVNSIIHPRVRAAFEQLVQETDQQLIFNEAAILFETGAYKQFDRMVLVTAPESLRIQRVMSRDGVGKDEVLARLTKQWPDHQKISLADIVLLNDEKEALLPQVERMIDQLISS